MAMQQLLKIVYALDIKFWLRWCTCSMWKILLPCCKLIGLLLFCLLFLISILFLKPNIRTLNTWTELPHLVMGTIFLVITRYGQLKNEVIIKCKVQDHESRLALVRRMRVFFINNGTETP